MVMSEMMYLIYPMGRWTFASYVLRHFQSNVSIIAPQLVIGESSQRPQIMSNQLLLGTDGANY